MADFVLVHGAWHGAWCWRKVLPALWLAGHRAFAVSLSGVGERRHIPPETVSLAMHVEDVVAVIEAEELHGAVLVGHSYGGLVITGVAERLAARLGHLVYLDAVVPRPGECWSSGNDAATRTARRQAIATHGVLPPPDPASFGLHGADAEWVRRRQTPHPGRPYDEVLDFDPGRVGSVPRTFVSCTAPALATIDPSRARVAAETGWRVIELATGHDPMISAPGAVVDLLRGLA
jgi:pimeloyl-ACP methyl ester carboxylesterase